MPSQELDFQRHMSWYVFYVQFYELMWKKNAHVVNIDDGVDHHCLKEKFEDTKKVIKSRKSKKDRKYNDITKQGIKHQQSTKHYTED
jgi:hypothetical protein